MNFMDAFISSETKSGPVSQGKYGWILPAEMIRHAKAIFLL